MGTIVPKWPWQSNAYKSPVLAEMCLSREGEASALLKVLADVPIPAAALPLMTAGTEPGFILDILLVEDDSFDVEMADLVLRRDSAAQINLTRVASLDAAMALVERKRFDAIILDLNLPDATGMEPVEQLALARHRVPIVVLSGNADEEFALRAIRAGAQDYVVKGSDGFSGLRRSIRYAMERKAAELRLKHLASYDPLTNLANRQELYFQLEKACAHADRHGDMVALLLFDLDRFKLVNDIHGHHTGDALLRAVAQHLEQAIRAGDTAARLGGDEFAVVLEGIPNLSAARTWSEDTLASLNKPITLDGRSFNVSASIGGAAYPTHGADVDALMRSADIAMYKIKQSGRNGFALYDEQMDQRLVRRQQLESELQGSLKAKEICCFFQPKVSLQSGEVTGLEALSRWVRADGDTVMPNEYLPIARLHHLMSEIGDATRAAALGFLQQRQRENRPIIPVSINVDPQELNEKEFADRVLRQLAEAGLSSRYLRVEITETTLLEQTNNCMNNLRKLRSAGIAIELDDFGAGHSSLNYLRKFAIDTLKLDRSLISGIGTDDHGALIVRAVVGLARELGLEVAAEGIETAQQLRILSDMGCQVGQGYLIARPMPGDDAGVWMDEQASRLPMRLNDLTGTYPALKALAISELRSERG